MTGIFVLSSILDAVECQNLEKTVCFQARKHALLLYDYASEALNVGLVGGNAVSYASF